MPAIPVPAIPVSATTDTVAATRAAAETAMADETVEPLAGITHAYSYDYQSSQVAPTSGQAHQHTSSLNTIAINETDHNSVDQSAFLSTLNNTCTLTINGVVFNILSASVATGVVTLLVSPPVAALPYGVQNITFFKPDQNTTVGGPVKPGLIPTSVLPAVLGSIGDPVGVPTFPPPTPPPIGTVPAGPLVGPAVAPAPVPPSLAGVVQPQYKTGSAIAPTAASVFPAFTTAPYTGFPNQPPNGVPIVFANISTNPSKAGSVWTAVPPPSTATTAPIILDGWGLPGPSGLGPGPPTYPTAPGTGLHDVGAVRDGHTEPAERSAGPVLFGSDTAHLHQSQSSPDSRRKRMSARNAAGRFDAA